MNTAAPLPNLACNPYAIPASKRLGHFALARRLFTKMAKERTELPAGFAFRFDSDALESLARFVVNESKCCPFIDFEITLGADSRELWLRMTGPEGTREVLQAELNLSHACGCC